jgi:hypothetical protein
MLKAGPLLKRSLQTNPAGDGGERNSETDGHGSHDTHFIVIAPDCGQIGQGSRQNFAAARLRRRFCIRSRMTTVTHHNGWDIAL